MNAGIDVPKGQRDFLRERLDDSAEGGAKVVAAKVGVHRNTLLNVVRDGRASGKTLRRLSRVFPEQFCAT